jgi:hypothetical protein
MAIQSGRDVSSPARVLRQRLSEASALVALQPTCQLTTGCERWRMTHRNDRSGTSPCLGNPIPLVTVALLDCSCFHVVLLMELPDVCVLSDEAEQVFASSSLRHCNRSKIAE